MKYIGKNGESCEIDGCLPSLEALITSSNGRRVLSLQKPEQGYTLLDLILAVKQVIAAKPPYISSDDIPWLLAYMDDFSDFVTSNQSDDWMAYSFAKDEIISYATNGTRRRRYDETAPIKPHFIELSRRFTCLEVIYAHLYGFGIPGSMFPIRSKEADRSSQNEVVDEDNNYIEILGLLRDEPYSRNNRAHPFSRDALDFLEEKRFKTLMSQNFFKRANGVFLIPKGMEIEIDLGHEKTILKSGAYGVVQVDRFYKTQGGWYDGGGPAGYPKSISPEANDSMMFIPILRCNLGDQGHSHYALELNIPLTWFTHTATIPNGFSGREFATTKIQTHKHHDLVDPSFDQAVHNMVSAKVNKSADEMEAMVRELYGHRR